MRPLDQSTVGALSALALLFLLIAFFGLFEAVVRWGQTPPPHGAILTAIAGVAFAGGLIWLIRFGSKGDD